MADIDFNKASAARIDRMKRASPEDNKRAQRALLTGAAFALGFLVAFHLAPRALGHTAQTVLDPEAYKGGASRHIEHSSEDL